MLETTIYFAIAYLIGSAGLYLFAPDFRRKLHQHDSGNTTVLHGLQRAGKKLAVLNLLIEILKPIAIVALGRAWLQIESPMLLLLGVNTAMLGRMYPIFLKFRHGGKGSLTALFGTVAAVPPMWLFILATVVVQICLLKFRQKWFRPFMTAYYLLFPLTATIYLQDTSLIPAFSFGSLITLFFGWTHEEDIKRGFSRSSE